MSHNLVKIVQLALLDNGGPVLSNEDARAAVVAVLNEGGKHFGETGDIHVALELIEWLSEIEGQQ